MATTATFDMSRQESVDKVTSALDDLPDVTWTCDEPKPVEGDDFRTSTSVDVYYNETPLWAYPLAALAAAAPWLIGAFTSLVDVSISADDGIDWSADTDAGSNPLIVVGSIAAIILGLAVAFFFATRFKRLAHQSTITAIAEPSDEATELTMSGSAERYIFLAVRRVFDKYDRDEIAKRADPDANFSIMDFLEIGPRRGSGGASPE